MERLKHFAGRIANHPSKQNNLTIEDDRDRHRRNQSGDPFASSRDPRDRPSGTPYRNDNGPAMTHRPSRSREEEERRMRGPPPRGGPPRPRGPPGQRPPNGHSPDRRDHRRVRRNSESSMIDHGSLDPEEERRRRERRRARDERSKDPKARSSRTRRPQGLDIIDRLDVTGIYGPSMIHHDGPYDAVQPHRNRKKDHRAPMEAFPVGSANNAIGGAGPVNQTIDLDTFHGRGNDAYADFGSAAQYKRPDIERGTSFNPKDRDDIVHGEASMGLGTSTFLDGAPASRTAIQRRESETNHEMAQGGLGRKKSIAQRIRGISQPRRNLGDPNSRIMSPEARYGNSARSPGSPKVVQSAGGIGRASELNPFFNEYDAAYDNKGAAIRESETREPTSSPGNPSRNPLARAMTADSFDQAGAADSKPQSGFLSRVKSLKGGRRRPERPAPAA